MALGCTFATSAFGDVVRNANRSSVVSPSLTFRTEVQPGTCSPAKNAGRPSAISNHAFPPRSWSGSAKRVNGTRQRFSGPSHLRQCGEAALRTLVTPRSVFLPTRYCGGVGKPHRALPAQRLRPPCAQSAPPGQGRFPAEAAGCLHGHGRAAARTTAASRPAPWSASRDYTSGPVSLRPNGGGASMGKPTTNATASSSVANRWAMGSPRRWRCGLGAMLAPAASLRVPFGSPPPASQTPPIDSPQKFRQLVPELTHRVVQHGGQATVQRGRAFAFLAGFAAFLLSGVLLDRVAQRHYLGEGETQAKAALRLTVQALDGYLRRFMAVPGLLSETVELRRLIENPADQNTVAAMNVWLTARNAELDASAIHVLDIEGALLASSDQGRATSLSAVPGLSQSIVSAGLQGRGGRILDVGSQPRYRGYIFSAPVRDAGGEPWRHRGGEGRP